jgi:hypothetical protein
MADIGAVRVVFGADIAQLQEGIKKATDALGSFGKAASVVAAGTGLEKAVERTFDAIVESVNKAIDSADKLAKASQKFGIPTDNLQVLAHAAELSDVSLEELGASVAKLSKNMIAAEGPTSDQAAAFKALGLSVNDLIKLRPDEAFLKVADAISRYADGTTKTAAVQAIFGKGAANLIPILNQGSAGFEELKKRMQDTGQIMSGAALAAAEKYKDTLTDLNKTKDALIIRIIGDSGLLAAMQRLAQSFGEAAGNSQKFEDNFGGLVSFIRGSIRDFENLAAGIEKVKAALPAANDAAEEGTRAWLGFEYGIEGVGQAVKPVPAIINETSNEVAQSAKEFAAAAIGMKAVQEAAAQFGKAQLNFSPEANKNLEAFNKEIAKLRAETLEASGVFGSQLAPGLLQTAAHLELTKNQVTLTGAEFGKLGPQAEQLNNDMLKLAGAKFFDQSLNPFERFQKEAAIADQGLQKMGYSAAEIADINEKNAERAGVSWKNATSDMLNSASSAFAGLAQKNKEFAGIAKALAISQATFNAYLAYTKALATYPPPFDIIGAGVALASGLAAVATIAATPFAKGGSFKVPGGMSGVDNQLVPLTLASGEQVDITPAGQAGGSRGRSQEIVLSGLGPRDLFTGTMLRDLVDALNAGARDGYKLKIAG